MAVEGTEPGLSEQAILASIIEVLVETFNASNDKTLEDPTKSQIQSSVFNNKLKNPALQQSENKIIQSLNGGEPGLYALVLRSEEIEAKQEGPPSTWWSVIMEGAASAASVAETVDSQIKSTGKDILDVLAGPLYDRPPIPEEELNALKALELLDFKGYYVFILTNVGNENPIPITMPPTEGIPGYTYTNLDSYPIAQAVSKRLRTEEEEIPPGTLVKIQYENAINRDSSIIAEIIEDRPEFTEVILASMAARSGLPQFDTCGTDSSLSGVTHPSGDAIGSAGSAAELHNAYMALNKAAGKNKIDIAVLYQTLLISLKDKNLVLGILANASSESGFDANIVSGVSTESSIGLWQMNVQSAGKIDVPTSSRRSLAKSTKANLPSSIQIPANAKVVPYFAGGLLLTAAGIPVITPAKYDGTQDLTASYNKVRDPAQQATFVIASVKKMLASIKYDATKITAKQWAYWFQIYFEQPADIHDRTAGVTTSAKAAGVTV